MTDKVLCPWCGARMSYRQLDHINGFYNCPQCLATGPAGRGEVDAREAALRRYAPPQKPMERQELPRHYLMPCWIERIGEKAYPDLLDKDSVGFYGKFENLNARETDYLLYANYGRTWRCWERKPTDEERSAAEWEISPE